MMVALTPALSVNTDLVRTVWIDHRDYVNGSANWLIVEFADSPPVRLEHGYGVDVFSLKQKIEEAINGR